MTETKSEPVTFSGKCYTYLCVGCGLLAQAARPDVLTCSGACRVRAHRNGSLKSLRAIAKNLDIPPAMILQFQAVELLRPDLADQIRTGPLSLDDVLAEVSNAFTKLLLAQIAAEDEQKPEPPS